MSNVLNNNPWILDTAATISATNMYRVRKMEWLPNASGDDLIIKDGAAKVIWNVLNAGGGGSVYKETIDFEKDGFNMVGFELDTIGGGTLYVFFS